MSGYRFRAEGELLVLQVYVPAKVSAYSYDREGTWRDATISDIPVADPFRRDPVVPEKCCSPSIGYAEPEEYR